MLRLILVFLIIFLLVRAFIITGLESRETSSGPAEGRDNRPKAKKGVPRELGAYVEYEEVKK